MKMTRIKCSLTQMCKLVVLMIKFKQELVMTKCKINNKWLVHHLNQGIYQMQAIKCKCFNQPMLQEIIPWTLSLVIFQDVCKLDQDWYEPARVEY